MPQKSITSYYSQTKLTNNVTSIKKKGLNHLDNTTLQKKVSTIISDETSLKIQTDQSQNSDLLIKSELNLAQGSPKRLSSQNEDNIINRSKRKRIKLNEDTSEIRVNHLRNGSARKKLELSKSEATLNINSNEPIVKNAKNVAEILKSVTDVPKIVSPLPRSPIQRQNSKKICDNLLEKSEAKLDSPSKLTPTEIKKRLGKCGKLTELQERLASVNDCSEQLKKLKSLHPYSPKKCHLSPKSSPGKISPLGSSRRSFAKVSPVKRQLTFSNESAKESSSTVPAYQKFHALSKPSSDSLILPFKFKVMAEVFRCVDTVVSMLHNRQEICTLTKIKSAVEEMRRKTFSITKLGQIKSVFPVAYFFKQEKIQKETNSAKGYDLTIIPNLTPSIEEVSLSSEHIDSLVRNEICKSTIKSCSQSSTQMNASCLLYRRGIFHNNLLDVVHKHHENFLSSLDPPIVIPKEKLTTWHPNFKIDRIEDIPPADLPMPPEIKTYDNAKDVLSKALAISGSGSKVEKALLNVIGHEDSLKTENISVETNIVKAEKKEERTALKGISESLLMKIRAKEAAKIAMQLQTSPEDNKNKAMMERFPDFIRIIRTYFIAEKKVALPIDDVIKKLFESYSTSLNPGDIDEHLKFLSSKLPTWLMILKLRKGTFVKIDKNKNLNALYEQVKKF